MKALVIDEPWIDKILRGKKIWEMRKATCRIRGRIGLIRKGSGQVVGVADLVDSKAPLASRKEYAVAERFHGIPPDQQAQAFAGGWRTPWVLARVRPLPRPVRYIHPSGAVIWVNLAADVETQIAAQVG